MLPFTLIQCPSCGWRPGFSDSWPCASCNQPWHVFDTRGVCPACAQPAAEISCQNCREQTPFVDWYHPAGEGNIHILHYPSHETLPLNFPLADFHAWQERLIESIAPFAEIPLTVCIEFTPGKTGFQSQVFSSEEHVAQREAVETALALLAQSSPQAQFASHTLVLESNLAAGSSHLPAESPRLQKQKRFAALTLREQIQSLRNWARKEAIPLLSAYAAQLDTRFQGIRSVGRRLPNVDPNFPNEPQRVTSGHPRYWQAFIDELMADDPLLVMMKILLHIGHGQFDLARDYHRMYAVFTNEHTVAHFYYEAFLWRFECLEQRLQAAFLQIQATLDAGDPATAVDLCNDILDAHPNSAHALFYRFRAAKMLGQLGANGLSPHWTSLQKKIFDIDPLFHETDDPKSALDAYHQALRQEAEALFVRLDKRDRFLIETLLRLGFIAMELGDHAFSAHVYALLLKFRGLLPITDRLNVASLMMYNLDKLKIKAMVARYKGNLLHDRRYISQYRDNLKQKHPAYRAFV